MQMKLTPRDHHVLNVLKRQGYVALGTEHCGTGTAAKLEQLGEVDLHSFVDRSGAIRFCIIPKGSDPDSIPYVKELRGVQAHNPVPTHSENEIVQPRANGEVREASVGPSEALQALNRASMTIHNLAQVIQLAIEKLETRH